MDETFWQGTLSEGQVSPIERNVEIVRALNRRGIVNSICSKNNFKEVESKLREIGIWDEFVFPSISWQPKGKAIKNLISAMQLRPQNVLFLDDNPLNLEESRFYSPDIQIAEPDFLLEIMENDFLKGKPDLELTRLAQYKILEKKHHDMPKSNGSNTDFLRASAIKVSIIDKYKDHFNRIEELINRSNQLNFTKKRVDSAAEIRRIFEDESYTSACIHVKDSYGDYGICGYFAIKNNILEHFVFSCRILNMGIESWLFHKVKKPKLSIVGEVATKIIDEIPDWINQMDFKDSLKEEKNLKTGSKEKKKIRILLKGGCDLHLLNDYLSTSSQIDCEFNFNSDSGFPIHTEHTVVLKNHSYTQNPEYVEIINELPFLSSKAYETRVFNGEYGVIVYSVLMDYTQGLYRHRRTGVVVPFGDFDQDITDAQNWSQVIEAQAHRDFNEKFLAKFKNDFEFVGPLSEKEFRNNLDAMRKMVRKECSIVFINGAEVDCDVARSQHHRKYNAVLSEFVDRAEGVFLLDVREIVKTKNDLLDGIRHYNRKSYFLLARELNQLLAKISFKGDATIQTVFSMLKGLFRSILRGIYYRYKSKSSENI